MAWAAGARGLLAQESDEGGDVRFGGLTPGHYSSLVFLGFGIYLARRVFLQPSQGVPPEIALGTATIGVPEEMRDEVSPNRNKSDAPAAADAPASSTSGSSSKAKARGKKR